MKNLRVKDLIEELQNLDPNLPIVITHDGKDHQYGITHNMIKEISNPYFGNDSNADISFQDDIKFLNIGTI